MRSRTVAILPVTLAIAVFLSAGTLAAQTSPTPTCTPNLFTIPKASRGHEVANEVYAPSVTAAVYLVNFLLLYRRIPTLPRTCRHIERPFLNRSSIASSKIQWAVPGLITGDTSMSRFSTTGNASGRTCVRRTQDGRAWRHAKPDALNKSTSHLGRRRADQLARLLGMDAGMILTDLEYHCVIGIPPRDHDRETIFRCIYNLTNSNGNAAIPLSSYGLNVTEQGDVRSICAPGSPCLEFNALFGGPLEAIFAECGCLEKLLRVEAETPLLQLIEDANPCQESDEPACLIETTCVGK